MVRYYRFLLIIILVFVTGLFTNHSAAASQVVKGTFVSVAYDKIQVDKDTVEKRLKTITIANSEGKTTTLNIDQRTLLSINTLPVSIDAFKKGMEIESDVDFRRVTALRGKSGESQGNIDYGNKVIVGTINRIDSKGKFLSIRLDDGQTQRYYFDEKTNIFKDTTLVGVGELYEGDRVKLTFSSYNTNKISKIEVNVQGVKVEAVYKGVIQRIEPIGNRIFIKDENVFRNWKWDKTAPKNNSYTYSSDTPIYVGNKQIKPEHLRYYKNHDVYYVTVGQFGKQVIEKMVIKQTNERTFYERMTAVNPAERWLQLETAGKVNYHNGTILIRNGRLVDSNSLQYSGTAFVITEGIQNSEYADVIYIANDGFQSPNLADHSVYFGEINSVGMYNLTLNNAKLLSENVWKTVDNPSLPFSNDTVTVKDSGSSILTILPKNEMVGYIGKYGYFYVEDQHIVAVHLIGKYPTAAELVSVGRMDGVVSASPDIIRVRNVSQWQKGKWEDIGQFSSMNIEQATIIRDGKVISVQDLQMGDRLYIVHESIVKGRLIFVD